jgi:hypothetical protein
MLLRGTLAWLGLMLLTILNGADGTCVPRTSPSSREAP